MSTIFLEPDKVTELEPVVETASKLAKLSPFAVPTSVEISVDENAHLAKMHFNYMGGETGDEMTCLDSEHDPVVTVLVGRHTHKILELQLAPPIERPTLASIAQLIRIAERIEARSETTPTPAGRLSYVLTARIIKRWASRIMQDVAGGIGPQV